MARIPPAGVGFQCFYEYEVTLAEVIAGLGLKPLDEEAERRCRQRVGFAIAKWREPNAGIDANDLADSLARLAKQLDAMDPLLGGVEIGIHKAEDIEGATRLASVLSQSPTISSIEAAHNYLSEFRERAGMIAHAAQIVAIQLRSVKGKSGRPSNDWYDGFVQAIADVCAKNEIAVKPVNSRGMDEPTGRFFEVAQGFERLLLPQMRSRTPHALAKRLNRSLNRIRVSFPGIDRQEAMCL